MKPSIDYTNLRSFSDIKNAKAKLRYSILLQENIISKSVDNLRGNFINSLKQSVWRWGMKIAIGFLLTQINLRTSKRGKKAWL